jgi:antitoxin MazE
MNVSKWGNSLAVRLPVTVVDALGLKEGDQIEIGIAGPREFTVARDRSREKAMETIQRLSRSFPKDFKFDREDLNEG